jgi:hypothetical protein
VHEFAVPVAIGELIMATQYGSCVVFTCTHDRSESSFWSRSVDPHSGKPTAKCRWIHRRILATPGVRTHERSPTAMLSRTCQLRFTMTPDNAAQLETAEENAHGPQDSYERWP